MTDLLNERKIVVVLGASSKPDRTSHTAVQMLLEYGHQAIPVHPKEKEISNLQVRSDLSEIKEEVDTLSVYVNPEISSELVDKILKLKPKRVIFNPGSENPSLKEKLESEGIQCEEACTLVLLRTQQF